jgi:hypothetical protein
MAMTGPSLAAVAVTFAIGHLASLMTIHIQLIEIAAGPGLRPASGS